MAWCTIQLLNDYKSLLNETFTVTCVNVGTVAILRCIQRKYQITFLYNQKIPNVRTPLVATFFALNKMSIDQPAEH